MPYTVSETRHIVDAQRTFFRSGTTLVISPFNFPILLTLGVVAASICGGNTVVIKASAKSRHCTEVRWDKIFYTGSPKVGRHVLAKAAENLTPVVPFRDSMERTRNFCRNAGICLLLCVTLLSVLSCSSASNRYMNGRSYDVDGITVLDLNGSWLEMGCQYGVLAKEKMDDVLEYIDLKIGADSARISSAAGIADSLYANYPSRLKEFFDGVSHTSGMSLERVKLCNAVEFVEGLFFCSAMAVWGGYGTGKLVFGRNYDAVSYSELDKDIVVTVYHPDEGFAAATVGYAGEIYCVNGLNEKGLFVELNTGKPSAGSETHWDLCPSTTNLFNMLFEAGSLDDADSFFKNTRSSLSLVIGVADKNEARSYEWCYDGVLRGDVVTEDGLMISTNHYVNEGWPFAVPTDETSWNSISRRRNLNGKAREYKGCIDAERMKEIMSTPLEDGGPKHSLTRYQIVAVPEDMILFIHIPSNGKWTELKMTDYI